MYSNTNYIFLARIIDVVTGENFEEWRKRNIIIPIGLSDTYIESDATKVVKGNATSYILQKYKSFSRAVEYWDYKGSGNVHSTVDNFLLWLNYFSNPISGWKSAFEMLQSTYTLNDGKKNNYAYGIEIDTINGTIRISHGGSVGGFRSFGCTFPVKGLSIAVMTNYSSSNPLEKVNTLTEKIIPRLSPKPDQDEKPYVGFASVANYDLSKYEGDYWDGKVARKIYVKNDTLWYFRRNGNESPLQYVGNDEFIIMPNALGKTKFIFDGGKIKSMLVESYGIQNHFKPFVPENITKEYLSEFEGKYFSPELDTYYTFKILNDTLVGSHPRHGSFNTEAQVKGDFFKSQGPMQTINFIRDEKSKVVGMRVSYDRVKIYGWRKNKPCINYQIPGSNLYLVLLV